MAELEEGICFDCRLLQAAAQETVRGETSFDNLRRPFQDALNSPDGPIEDSVSVPREVETVRRMRPESVSGKFTLVQKY